jgi:hypothetical protein
LRSCVLARVLTPLLLMLLGQFHGRRKKLRLLLIGLGHLLVRHVLGHLRSLVGIDYSTWSLVEGRFLLI